jgi:hypothetical protein
MTYEQRNWEGKKRAYGWHFTGIGMVYSGHQEARPFIFNGNHFNGNVMV